MKKTAIKEVNFRFENTGLVIYKNTHWIYFNAQKVIAMRAEVVSAPEKWGAFYFQSIPLMIIDVLDKNNIQPTSAAISEVRSSLMELLGLPTDEYGFEKAFCNLKQCKYDNFSFYVDGEEQYVYQSKYLTKHDGFKYISFPDIKYTMMWIVGILVCLFAILVLWNAVMDNPYILFNEL